MKKIAMAVCAVCLFGGISFAQSAGQDGGNGDSKISKEQKAKFETIIKERMEYFDNVQALVDKYNKATDQDKPAVKDEIKTLVTQEVDKDLAARKEMLANQKDRIAKFEKEIADIEKDKQGYINKKVDFLTGPDGQKKLAELKARFEKREQRGEVAGDNGSIVNTVVISTDIIVSSPTAK